jgi:dephospho-CoA kinase
MPGAGKGECAKIARAAGFTVVSMGDIIREHVTSLGLEMTDENIGGTAHSEREQFGYDIWAHRTVDRINTLDRTKSDLVVIDGIRGSAEVQVFKQAFGSNFKTVAILMPSTRRFELLVARKRSDAPITRAEFAARDEREVKWGIRDAIDHADYSISNTGTLKELETLFRRLLNRINEENMDI